MLFKSLLLYVNGCWLDPFYLFISLPCQTKANGNYLSFKKKKKKTKTIFFYRTNRAYRGGWGLATKALASTTCKTSSSHERFAVLFVVCLFVFVLC